MCDTSEEPNGFNDYKSEDKTQEYCPKCLAQKF